MGRLKSGLVLCLWLVVEPAQAVFEDASDSAANVRSRVDGEALAASPEAVLLKEEERQAAARERAERIRSLPPDKVKAWAEGRVSDEELARNAAAPGEPCGDAAVTVTVPRSRVIRLGLCSALVVFLAGALWRRRRQDQVARVKGVRRP